MKKLMILPVIAILALGSTSCKKDWNCVCNGTTIDTYQNITKADAKKACDASGALGGESCSVK